MYAGIARRLRLIAIMTAVVVWAGSLPLSVFADADESMSPLPDGIEALIEQLNEGTAEVGEAEEPDRTQDGGQGSDGGSEELGRMEGGEQGDSNEWPLAGEADAGGQPIKLSVGAAPSTGDSRASSASGDGRFVAFASGSSVLVEGDTNGRQDIFVIDRSTSELRRISMGAGGVQPNHDSYAPSISLDGNYVLFSSKASNLVAGDTNNAEDLFLYDAGDGKVKRLAESVHGSEYGGSGSPYMISADGRFAAYSGKSSRLESSHDILLKDLRDGTVTVVARQPYLYDNTRSRVTISADGRYIAFDSFSRNIVPQDAGGNYSGKFRDVYLYDAALGEMRRISEPASGGQANGHSQYPAVSADGRYVAYQSRATNIVPDDTGSMLDIYVYDRISGVTELASAGADGASMAGPAYDAAISGDGRFVAFHTSNAYDSADEGGLQDVYIRDRQAGSTSWVSRATTGGNPDRDSTRVSLSADGRSAVFETQATNLSSEPNGDAFFDLYAVQLAGGGAPAPSWPDDAVTDAASGATYVALSWPPAVGATYYKVMANGRTAGITQRTSLVVEALAPGTEGRYTVLAGSADYQWSAPLPEAVVATLAERETTAPGAVSITIHSLPGGAEVGWSYPADADIVGARLLWRKPGGHATESILYPPNVTRSVVPNLENGGAYELAAAVMDGDGNRSVSQWQTVTLPEGPALARIDVRPSDGRPSQSAELDALDVSQDGRYTLFLSDAADLAPGDANDEDDLFLHDSATGLVALISRTPSGASGNGPVRGGSMSDDGRYIVFASQATDMTTDPTSRSQYDIYLYDRDTNGNGVFDEPGAVSMTKLSVTPAGRQASGSSMTPVISGDGTVILFYTSARDLIESPPEGSAYNVLYDMGTGTMEPLLLGDGVSPRSTVFALNRDGSVAAFLSTLDLDTGDTNGGSDIYLYNRVSGELKWASNVDAGDRTGVGYHVSIDDSGRQAAFTLQKRSQPTSVVYVYDSHAEPGSEHELISGPLSGNALSGYSAGGVISGSGRYVAFDSSVPNLVEGDSDAVTNIFVRDRLTRTTTMASVPYDSRLPITENAYGARISGDGSRVAYKSAMMNLVRGSERSGAGLYSQRVGFAAAAAEWPDGSEATVTAKGRDYATLAWSEALGASGGYRITGGPSAVMVPSGTLTATVTGLSPDTHYTFKIEASNGGGNWTSNGPSISARTEAGLAIASFSHSAPLYSRQYAGIGDMVPLALRTTFGAEARAEVSYEAADGTGHTLPVQLAEVEAEPGLYRGAFVIPSGSVRLLSVKAYAEKDGSEAEAEALRASIPIGATANVTISGDSRIGDDAVITIGSASTRAYQSVAVGPDGTAVIKGMPTAEDYRFGLFDARGYDLLQESPPPLWAVVGGREHELEIEVLQPAALAIRAVYGSEEPARNTRVLVSDEEGEPVGQGLTDAEGNLTLPAFHRMIGQEVEIRATSIDPRFQDGVRSLVLTSGPNFVEVALPRASDVEVTGTVTKLNGDPLADAVVNVAQGGKVYAGVTNEEGRYTLYVPPGGASIQAVAGGAQKTRVQNVLLAGNAQTVDLQFLFELPSSINVKLYTKSGNGPWVGPYDLDWRERVHFRLQFSVKTMGTQNPMMVDARPGDEVEVCANGVEGDFASACGMAVIGEDGTGEAEIRIHDTLARVTGRLPEVGSQLQLYRLENGASRRSIMSRAVTEPAFELKLPGAGAYEIVYRLGTQSLIRAFEAGEGTTVELGDLTFGAQGRFSGQTGNSVLLGAGRLAPNSSVQVRGRYANSSGDTLGNAAIMLDIPADAELVPGSVVWNGQPAEASSREGRYWLSLGTLAGKATGSFQYQLRIAAEPAGSAMTVEPRLVYDFGNSPVEETIGTATAKVAAVTIEAPYRTARRDIPASGTAGPGSRVAVYAGDLLLGETEASPSGLWRMSVQLPGEGASSVWQLRAISLQNGREQVSSWIAVRYDETAAEPVEFTMRQADGRTMVLDPAQGVARFPYVVLPGRPFYLTLRFNHPELVSNVVFRIGDEKFPASLQDGVYQVIAAPKKPGAIGVDYTLREADASWNAEQPSSEDILTQLPPAFQHSVQDDLYVSPREGGDRKQSMAYLGTLPLAAGDAQLDVSSTMERMTYSPSALDEELAAETGIPVYGFQNTTSFRNGEFRAELTGYLPADRFGEASDAGEAMALLTEAMNRDLLQPLTHKEARVQALSGAFQAVKVTVNLAMKSKAGENTWKTIDAAYSVHDGMGVTSTIDRLNQLLDKITDQCPPRYAPIYLDYLEHLRDKAIENELIKAGVMVAGAVLGPSTFGIGTIALFLASNMFGKYLDARLAQLMDDLDAELNDSCEIEEEPDEPLTDPEYIYDPSGYVYEVAENNRIEDVKATVLRWLPAEERWEIWDAEWYGQDNPQMTGRDGRYGWDVPEGLWKVRYEKEGYLPAESEELTVLPPHFDVNIPMVSTLPSAPLRVSAAPGGAYAELLFDRPVKGDTVSEGQFAMVDIEDGGVVPGEWSIVDPVEAGGGPASWSVRFMPEDPLQVGRTYELEVDRSVQSYAGVPMRRNYAMELTVTDVDSNPPAPAYGVGAVVDARGALLSWKLPRDPDLDKLEVRHKPQSSGEWITAELPADQTSIWLEGLREGTSYDFEIRSYDEAGNYSSANATAVTAGLQPLAPERTPPLPVSNATAQPGSNSVALAWEDPASEDLSFINVQWGKEGEWQDGSQSANVEAGKESYVMTGLSASTAYEVRIWGVDASGNESDRVSLFFRTTTGTGNGGTGGTGGNGGNGDPDDGTGTQDPAAETAELGHEAATLSFFGGRLRLDLPEGAAGSAKLLTAKERAEIPNVSDKRLRPVSPAYEWELDNGRRLTAQGLLTIVYDASKLRGADLRKLGVYRSKDLAAGEWIYVGGVANGADRSIQVDVVEPGLYMVMLAEFTFSDLEGHWSRSDVEALAARGIVTGDPGGTFRPEGTITRAEFAKLISSLLVTDAVTDDTHFVDVSEDSWFAVAVAKASAAGIVMGDGDGRFRPNDPVTREEIAVMLFRLLKVDPAIKLGAEAILGEFPDGGDVSAWARTGMAYAVHSGLIKGSGGKLMPAEFATRAEASVMILRIMSLMDA